MRARDVRIGQRVIAPLDCDDVGTVECFDEHNGIAYVRFPVPGRPGESDVIDYDPGDLASAEPPKEARQWRTTDRCEICGRFVGRYPVGFCCDIHCRDCICRDCRDCPPSAPPIPKGGK
jgi:hypothetical protein